MNFNKYRYILTGTPGSGKTTLIEELEKYGAHVIHEAATDIIKLEQESRNHEPWRSIEFIEKIILLQRSRQLNALNLQSRIEFYDRSPICTYALALYLGFDPLTLSELRKEIERIKKENIYQKKVFFTENLGFIQNTEARKISFEEALKFEQRHLETYESFGYECIIVPFMDMKKRYEFIQSNLDEPI